MTKKKATRRAKHSKELAKRELTEQEKERMANYQERRKTPPIKFKSWQSESGELGITPIDIDDPMVAVKMSEAFGTIDADLQTRLLNQVLQTFGDVASTGEADYEQAAVAANRAVALLAGIGPRDEIEGMLAVQMVGVQNMAMQCLRQSVRSRWVNQMRDYLNAASKLMRTYAVQMGALKKYRSAGPQKMVVEHVSVSKGGQAIVGTVNQRIEKTSDPKHVGNE